jgi:hypothetical protein
MQHVIYSLFEDIDHATAAIDGIESSGPPRCRCDVVIHKDRLDDSGLNMAERASSEGLREGAALGAILGASVGAAVSGPMGLVSGGALGALYGGVAGAIAGSSGPDRSLVKLSKELAPGKVLVVVEAPGLACRDKAGRVMRHYGGRVALKPYF